MNETSGWTERWLNGNYVWTIFKKQKNKYRGANRKLLWTILNMNEKGYLKKIVEQKLCMNDFKKEGANGNLVWTGKIVMNYFEYERKT